MTTTTQALFRKCVAASAALALPALVLVPACGTNKGSPSNANATVSTPVAPPAPAPPPPPPIETSLGTLARVERSDQIDLHVLCVGGNSIHATAGAEVYQAAADLCLAKDKASKGKTYLVLHFEGKPTRELEKEFGKFVATSGEGFLARVDESSWLGDDQQKKYANGFAVTKKKESVRQIAFEVPADATGFTWRDGKKQHPVREPAPKPAGPR